VIEPEHYARWRASALGTLTERLEQDAIFSLAGDMRERRVLDVGCGDGAQSIAAYQRGGRVTGVDTSLAMLEAARHRAEIDSAEIIGWRQASAEQLPFHSQAFDVVIAVTALCFMKNPQRAVVEAARVLRPSGRLIIGELGRYSLWALSRRIRGWLGSSTWRKARFWTIGELRRLVELTGLQFHSARGCVYYPPIAPVAQPMAKLDHVVSRIGSVGAAFLAARADKI
jgi:ubiquinone/menaquinone biosynthesis C-methylase UbiE